MADLGTGYVTLAQWAKHLAPDGGIAKIAEVLNKQNDILEDIPMVASNQATAHRITIRDSNGSTRGLPSGTWRSLNAGVVPEVEITKQVDESMGMLETYSEVDKKLAELNGNTMEWRFQKDRAFIEGLGQTMADAIFNANISGSVNPAQFNGLASRYASLGTQCISGGGSGSNMHQIWIVLWGDNQVYGIHPNGLPAGLQVQDLGEQTKVDSNGKMWQVLRSHFTWDMGIAVEDNRCVIRVVNIDPATISKSGSSGADIPDLLSQCLDLVPPFTSNSRGCIYMNSTVKSYFRRQMSNRSNIWLKPNEFGREQLMFNEWPIRRCDAIGTHASAIS
jgi:hypothetical protein